MQTRKKLAALKGGKTTQLGDGPLAGIAEQLAAAFDARETARMAAAHERAAAIGTGPHLAALQRLAREAATAALADNTAPCILRADLLQVLATASKQEPADRGLSMARAHAYRLWSKEPTGVLTVGDVARLRTHYHRAHPRSRVATVLDHGVPAVGFNTLPLRRLFTIAGNIARVGGEDLQAAFDATMVHEGLDGNKPEQFRARAYVRALLEGDTTADDPILRAAQMDDEMSHDDGAEPTPAEPMDDDMSMGESELEVPHDESSETMTEVESPITGEPLALELGLAEGSGDEGGGAELSGSTGGPDAGTAGMGMGLEHMGQLEDLMVGEESSTIIEDPSSPGDELEVVLRPVQQEGGEGEAEAAPPMLPAEEEPMSGAGMPMESAADKCAECGGSHDEGMEHESVAPPGWESTVKKMKKHPEIESPWALAWYEKEKGYKPHPHKQSAYTVTAVNNGVTANAPLETFKAAGIMAALKRVAMHGVKGAVHASPSKAVIDLGGKNYLIIQAAPKEDPFAGDVDFDDRTEHHLNAPGAHSNTRSWVYPSKEHFVQHLQEIGLPPAEQEEEMHRYDRGLPPKDQRLAKRTANENETPTKREPDDGMPEMEVEGQPADAVKGLADAAKVLRAATLTVDQVRKICAKRGLTAAKIENDLLNGVEVIASTWSIRINDNAEVELTKVDTGRGRVASLIDLDEAIGDFMAHVASMPVCGHYEARPLFAVKCAACPSLNVYVMPDEPAALKCTACGHVTAAAAVAKIAAREASYTGYLVTADIPGGVGDKPINAKRMFAAIRNVVADAVQAPSADGRLHFEIKADEAALNRVRKVLEDRYGVHAQMQQVGPQQPGMPGQPAPMNPAQMQPQPMQNMGPKPMQPGGGQVAVKADDDGDGAGNTDDLLDMSQMSEEEERAYWRDHDERLKREKKEDEAKHGPADWVEHKNATYSVAYTTKGASRTVKVEAAGPGAAQALVAKHHPDAKITAVKKVTADNLLPLKDAARAMGMYGEELQELIAELESGAMPDAAKMQKVLRDMQTVAVLHPSANEMKRDDIRYGMEVLRKLMQAQAAKPKASRSAQAVPEQALAAPGDDALPAGGGEDMPMDEGALPADGAPPPVQGEGFNSVDAEAVRAAMTHFRNTGLGPIEAFSQFSKIDKYKDLLARFGDESSPARHAAEAEIIKMTGDIYAKPALMSTAALSDTRKADLPNVGKPPASRGNKVSLPSPAAILGKDSSQGHPAGLSPKGPIKSQHKPQGHFPDHMMPGMTDSGHPAGLQPFSGKPSATHDPKSQKGTALPSKDHEPDTGSSDNKETKSWDAISKGAPKNIRSK